MSATSFKVKIYEGYRKADILQAIERSPSLQRHVSVHISIKDILWPNNSKKGGTLVERAPVVKDTLGQSLGTSRAVG